MKRFFKNTVLGIIIFLTCALLLFSGCLIISDGSKRNIDISGKYYIYKSCKNEIDLLNNAFNFDTYQYGESYVEYKKDGTFVFQDIYGEVYTGKYECIHFDKYEKCTLGKETDFLMNLSDDLSIEAYFTTKSVISAGGPFVEFSLDGIEYYFNSSNENIKGLKYLNDRVIPLYIQYIEIFNISEKLIPKYQSGVSYEGFYPEEKCYKSYCGTIIEEKGEYKLKFLNKSEEIEFLSITGDRIWTYKYYRETQTIIKSGNILKEGNCYVAYDKSSWKENAVKEYYAVIYFDYEVLGI